MKTKRHGGTIMNGRKWIFVTGVFASFVMIFFLNLCTPTMSDDISYGLMVSKATSFSDLIKQEYMHYMSWTGRNVVHLLLRIFLYLDQTVFIVCNSLAFLLLSFLIYWNVEGRKKYDVVLFMLIQVMLYAFSVSFGETLLWKTGACNYLWGSVIILGFVTVMKWLLVNDLKKSGKLVQGCLTIGLLIFGILAGWCNENTSGGGFLIMIGMIFLVSYQKSEKTDQKIRLKGILFSGISILKRKFYLVSGILGMCIGLGFMTLAPGNQIRRAAQEEENYTGLLGLVSRALKETIVMKGLFTELVIILVFAVVLMMLQKAAVEKLIRVGIYTIAALATGYVLIFVSVPSDRAYFGMGIMLIIACLQAVYSLQEDGEMLFVKWIRYSVCVCGVIWLLVTFLEEGANVARINREYRQRDQIAQMQKDAGEQRLVLPMLRPGFETPYSFGYESDLSKDPEDWINQYYCAYYQVETVVGMPRDEWEENYGSLYGME